MNDKHLVRSEAKNLPLSLVIQSFQPYIEGKIRSFSIPGQELDDLRQEAYVALLSAIGSYDEHRGSSFSTYAIACINNRFNDAIKSAGRQKNRILNESVSLTEDENRPDLFAVDSPEEIAIGWDEYRRIRESIDRDLSETERNVLNLWIDGYTYDEITESLGMSPKAVNNALQRARKKLKSK